MDFMHDQLADGRSIRLFNVIVDYNRGGLAIDVDFSPPSERVIRSVGGPDHRMGRQTERHSLRQWPRIHQRSDAGMEAQRVAFASISSSRGNSRKNAYVERYNRTVRYGLLAHHLFETLDEIQDLYHAIVWTCNHDRPNMALGGITLKKKLAIGA